MAIVTFASGFLEHIGGEERVEIDARRVVDLVEAIYARYPSLQGELDGMAVAIDDEVHNNARFLRLEADSEVQFVPRIGGGA